VTRRTYVVVTALAAGAAVASFAEVAIVGPRPWLIWNASASAPIGLYALRPVGDPPRGVLVAVRPPQPLAAWMAARGYLPEGLPLLKHVVAKAGQRVCRRGLVVTVDGRPLASARERDSRGRLLPVWQGCRTLARGELMLMNLAVPDSLDGRYFGPLPASAVLGRAAPILTRNPPDGRFHWRAPLP
jgi:conjugative transfer signal peptidase TraF